MLRRLLSTGLMLGLCGLSLAADAEKKATDKEVASAYFEALMTGDVEKADEMVTVPYSFDRKMVLAKKAEVEAKHRAILADKGKRNVPKYKTAVPNNAPALDGKVFPAHTVVRILIEGDDEYIDIYVTTGENPKVIGFSD